MNLSPGATYWKEAVVETTTENDMFLNSEENSNKQTTVVHYKVLSEENGKFRLKTSYDMLELEMTAREVEAAELDDLLKIMKGLSAELKKSSFELIINSNGELIEVIDFDAVMDAIQTFIDSLVHDKRASAVKILSFLNESFFKESFESAWSFIPLEEVRIGQSWQKTLEVYKLFGMVMHYNYTLTEITEDHFLIDILGDVEIDKNSSFLDLLAEMGNVDFAGDIHGKLKIDRSSGWIMEAELFQIFDMNTKLQMPGAEEEMTMKMKSTSVSSMRGGVK